MRRNLTVWEPIKNLLGTDDVFDSFFTRNMRPYGPYINVPGKNDGFGPVDIYEKDGRIVAKAEIPGMEKSDIKVSVEDDLLTISGEKKKEEETEKNNYYCSERVYGSFSRTIQLPDSVDRDNVKASYKEGVLTVELPKLQPAEVKATEIKID